MGFKRLGGWTKGPRVVSVLRDLDAFELGRGAFVQAVERCDKAHAWQDALSLHQLMLDEGYGYSLSGFHALLMKQQAAQKWQWQRAVHYLEVMNLYDIFPSSITISLLISCCRRANEWRWPLDFMMSHLETKKKELTDSHSMGSVIGSCLDARQWHWATRLLDLWATNSHHQTDQKNLEMNEMSIFNLAITICKVTRQWHKALELCKASKQVNDIAVAATMKALGRRWQMCPGHLEIDRL